MLRCDEHQSYHPTPRLDLRESCYHHPTLRPPHPSELLRRYPQSIERSFKSVGSATNALFFLVRDDWLTQDELRRVACLSRPISQMTREVPKARERDFSTLLAPRPNFMDQQTLDEARRQDMTAAFTYYGGDISMVIRFLGGEYTGAWRDEEALLTRLGTLLPDDDKDHIRRILRLGTPAEFNHEMPLDKKERAIAREPSSSLTKYREIVNKTMVKEEKHHHIICLDSWTVHASAYTYVTPQTIIYKNGKGRLIWDGTSKLYWDDVVMNEITPTDKEADVTFGTVFRRYCTYLWNLRITYPDEDIVLAFLDISACFRWPRLSPDLAGAFGFLHEDNFVVPNAMVFGSTVSASTWDPLRRAVTVLGEDNFRDSSLVEKHAELLEAIKWEDPPREGQNFARAVACTKNPGVIDPVTGVARPSEMNVYVDDNMLAAVRRLMAQTLAAAAEGTFEVCGFPDLTHRQSALQIEKLENLTIAHAMVLLGFLFNTRTMTVGIPPAFRADLLQLLRSKWHAGRVMFTVRELEELVGKLGRVGQVFRPIYHLMPQMYASVAFALRQNSARLCTTSKQFRDMMQEVKQQQHESNPAYDSRRVSYALRETARRAHRHGAAYRIPPSLRAELDFVTRLIDDETIPLQTKIGHMVDRDFTWEVAGDACKSAGGGWSTDLRFWWFLAFRDDIVSRARLANNSDGRLIDINCLETVVIIINLAGAIYTCHVDGIDLSCLPMLLNWCDNTSACSWVNKKCRTSLVGRALGRFFIGLLLGTDIGVQAEWLSTTANVVADAISRLKRTGRDYNFSRLLQDYPQLRRCRQFIPSPTLVEMIYDTLLQRCSPDPIQLSKLRPETLGSFSS